MLTACAVRPLPKPAVAKWAPSPAFAVMERAGREAALGLDNCGQVTLLLTTSGVRDADSRELVAFLDAHRRASSDLFEAGVDSSAIGLCCGPGRSLCIALFVWEDSPAVRALPAELARVVAAEGIAARMRIAVSFLVAPKARCHAGDADCGPQPVARSVRILPRPIGWRRLIKGRNGKPFLDGKCSGDGECRVNCGCLSLESRAFMCSYAWYFQANFENAWCGCVDGACAWFH